MHQGIPWGTVLWGFLLLAQGCGQGGTDSPGKDIHTSDAGLGTEGLHTSDSSQPHGTPNDAAAVDSVSDSEGTGDVDLEIVLPDAVAADISEVIGGSTLLTPIVPCDDSVELVYTMSSVDADMTVPRGSVQACATGESWSLEVMKSEAMKVQVEAVNGVRSYRISYVTQRSFGEKGLASARVLVSDEPLDKPAPVVVVTHGTAGLADACAPSKASELPTMGTPFAGTGYVVILPDYAGLGTEGVQGYADTLDTTASVFDAVRAVHSLFPTGTVADQYAVLGHSQGGGVALNVQALSAELEQELATVVAFSPGWVSSAEPSPTLYKAPQFIPVTAGAGTSAVVTAFLLYADAYNHVDAATPGMFFSDAWRDTIVGWIESDCVYKVAQQFLALGAGVTAKDILSPTFLNVSLSCLEEKPGCTEPYKSALERRKAAYVPMDTNGVPTLYVQALNDKQATPSRAACYIAAMEASGYSPFVSVDVEADHFDVVERNVSLAYDWIHAAMQGTEPPTWAFDHTTLPTCE